MRIDLSPKGQVLGTRRVLENGQIHGLADHVGEDILLVVPNGRPIVKNTVADYLHDWQAIAEKNAKRAAKEWKAFEKKLPKTRAEAMKLAKQQIELAKKELDMQKLVRRLPVRRARRSLEKRIQVARRQVRGAEKWIRSRVPALAPARSARKSAPRAAA